MVKRLPYKFILVTVDGVTAWGTEGHNRFI